jgi:hypothetical protein
MKTTEELFDGMTVLANALIEAGAVFQFSGAVGGRIFMSWSGHEHEVLGMCETLKAKHLCETHKTPNAIAKGREHSERPA